MSTTKEAPATKAVVKVRLSFPHLFTPTSFDDSEGKKKYQALGLIPKTDKKTLATVNAAIEAAKEEGKAKKWGGKLPKNLELPLRDGDDKDNVGDEFNNVFFINAKSASKPGLVKRVKGVEGLVQIVDEDELYAGCYVLMSVNFYPYDQNGKKGIACGLNNVLFAEHGERLAGRASAEDDFAAFIESDSEEGADEDDDDI